MPKKPHDPIEMLDADHRSVLGLFDQYRQLAGHCAPGNKRKALAEQICMELTIHMRLEEEIFYPPLREAIRAGELLEEAEVEHAGAKELIAQLLAMPPEDELYDAKMNVLGESIARHVKEEREEMFPKARSSGIDLAGLGETLHVRRQELQVVSEALREDALASACA